MTEDEQIGTGYLRDNTVLRVANPLTIPYHHFFRYWLIECVFVVGVVCVADDDLLIAGNQFDNHREVGNLWQKVFELHILLRIKLAPPSTAV